MGPFSLAILYVETLQAAKKATKQRKAIEGRKRRKEREAGRGFGRTALVVTAATNEEFTLPWITH